MNSSPEWAFMYGAGRLTLFHQSSQPEDSFFGGPFELATDRRDDVRLHRTLTIRGSLLPTGAERRIIGSVSLVYAFRYEQNQIGYRFRGADIPEQGVWLEEGTIQDLQLDEATYLEEWPYKHYPPIFPITNLRAQDAGVIGEESLRERYGLGNATWNSHDVLVGVPTNRTMGFSIWGLQGDRQGVVLLFAIDVRSLRVTAWHTLP